MGLDIPISSRLRRYAWGTPSARVYIGGMQAPADSTIPLRAGTVETTVIVRRVTPGLATTVPLTVFDLCGRWPTFVGGGPDSF
jgi:hypothetical protein